MLKVTFEGILKLIDYRSFRLSAKIYSGTFTKIRFLIIAKIVNLAIGDASTRSLNIV